MKRILPGSPLLTAVAIVVTFLATRDNSCFVEAQGAAFSRQVSCPAEPALSGYVSANDLNADMADERARVDGGGARPASGYNMVICPNPTAPFVIEDAPIRPVLDQINISCGGPQSISPSCLVTGGETSQVSIQESTNPDYPINNVQFTGMTFSDAQTSIILEGKEPAVATFDKVTWQDPGDGAETMIDVRRTDNDTPMTLRITNSVIESSDGTPTSASTSEAFLRNEGGRVVVEGMRISNILAETVSK